MADSMTFKQWIYAAALTAVAVPAQAGLLNLAWDNDFLTGSDRGYTNGVRLSWLGDSAESNPRCDQGCATNHVRTALSWLPGIGGADRQHALSVSVSQAMITPENIESREPVYNDLPYVGYLAVQPGIYAWSDRVLTGYALNVGVVGKESGASQMQRWVHHMIGSTRPLGWDNQLGTDVLGGISAIHVRRLFTGQLNNGLQHEWTWGVGARLNSFISDAETGFSYRIGRNLPGNFVPEYAGASPSLGLPGLLETQSWGWDVFASVLVQGVAYSYIEEKGGPYNYRKKDAVGALTLGVGLHSRNFHMALAVRASTAQEDENKEAMTFGTLSFSWRI